MANGERDLFDSLVTKLANTCEENDLVYTLQTSRYPVAVTIKPDQSMEGQISMLDNEVGYNNKDCVLQFIFLDGKLTYKISEGFTLAESTFNKLRNLAKKIHAAYMMCFFREWMEAAHLVDMQAKQKEHVEPAADDDAGMPDELPEDELWSDDQDGK